MLLQLLAQLEDEMRKQQLWAVQPPSPEALASTMPFMYDSLELHEWLQWVFVPRLRALVDAQGQLPCQSHIHPLAEHEWSQRGDFDGRRMLALLLELDELLNSCAMTPPDDMAH